MLFTLKLNHVIYAHGVWEVYLCARVWGGAHARYLLDLYLSINVLRLCAGSTSTDSLSCSPRLFLPLSRLSMLVHSLDLVILPHFRLSIHFCFLSTSSRLYLSCLSCRRSCINSFSIYVLVHTRLLSLFIHAPSHSPIYSFYSCLFIRDVHLLIWFTLLSLVSVLLFLVYFFSSRPLSSVLILLS